MRRFLAAFIVCVAISSIAGGYTRITTTSGQSPRWATMPVPYWISAAGSSQISNDSEFLAVQEAFRTWESVATASVQFNYNGTTPVNAVGRDGINLVSFSDPSIPLGEGTLAVTFLFFETQNGPPTIAEADILLNSVKGWVTSGDTNRYDIQSVVTHEVGHLLGLDHSGVMSSVMYPYGQTTVINDRFLKYDDMAGVSEIYPSPSAAVGEIRGSVTYGSAAVFGAHVVALDLDGQPLVATVSLADGSYRIRSLPAGTYRVYAEPLDGPVTEDALGGFYTGLQTDFGPTFAGNASTLAQARSIEVVAGQDPPVADIQVFPRPSAGLNVTGYPFPSYIARSSETDRGVSGPDIKSGVVVSTSSPSVLSEVRSFYTDSGVPAAGVNLRVLPSAPLGPKSLFVNRGNDMAVSTGAVVVTNAKPSVGDVFPRKGTTDGLQTISITGQNFRPGLRVYLGGLLAPEVRYISSTALDVITPPSPVAGGVSILVVNADGTSDLETSSPAPYIYDAGAPVITSVSPLSGPPGTAVTIEGKNLNVPDLQVLFNGTIARISTVSSARIVTAVPYATTGDITVSTIRGPVFTVTAPVPSSNRATGAYAFVDASPQAGGTEISFSDPNDAVSFVTLPINFTLFRGAYAAGGQIAVSTNGWLSLGTSSSVVPEYMNARLKATGVTRPSRSGCLNKPATSGEIQRELIAPFFDDLVMVPGVSAVSTRVVGAQPNRQFIVQWSKMGILDENACDVGGSVTFQAVLYEGSNDVLFSYDTMTGPRSSGGSATIGLQSSTATFPMMTSYNTPQVRSGFFIAYAFQDSSSTKMPTLETCYTRLLSDLTPPSAPDVRTASVEKSLNGMNASWIADDLDTGIREYQYAIGTSPGASDLVPFTSTPQTWASLTTPPMQDGGTYYFSVRAVNNDGLVGPLGFSNPIRIDSAFQVPTQVIPYAQWGSNRYTGIALLSPVPNSVQLRAINNAGVQVATANMNILPGWQDARLFSDLFRFTTINSSFDGWIEVVPSAAGLGVFTVSGSSDNNELDGAVSSAPSNDFVAMHPGSLLVLVNPSTQTATINLQSIADGSVQSLSIPARGRTTTTLASVSRVMSSVPLGALEVMQAPGRMSLAEPTPVSSASSTLTFVHSIVGDGYSTTITLVNLGANSRKLTVRFAEWTRELQLAGNSSAVLSLNDLVGNPQGIHTDAVRISSDGTPGDPGMLLGAVDVQNAVNQVSLGSRPLGTDWTFPHVAHGDGFFTGLVLVNGNTETQVRIDIYTARGESRISGVVRMGPNQQLGKLLSEHVPDFPIQSGGYIRVRSDQPILAWEVYGTPGAFVSGPPLRN